MFRQHTVLTLLAAVLILPPTTAVATTTPSQSTAARPACSESWSHAPVTRAGELGDWLTGVTATSPGQAWAVGYSLDPPPDGSWYGETTPIIHRWDGVAWSAGSVARPEGAVGARLDAVAGTSATDAWAVGTAEFADAGTELPPTERPFILHWDGSAWTRTTAPGSGWLTSVVALAPDDAWAVGSWRPDPESIETVHPLTMHWDGTDWTVVEHQDSMGPFASARLESVDGGPGGQVWAVGHGTRDGMVEETIAWIWDGAQWSTVPTPNPRRAALKSFGTSLHDVVVTSSGGVTAVGTSGTDEFVIRWNGSRWQRIHTNVSGVAGLQAVAVSDWGMIAVGNRLDPDTFDVRGLAVDLRGRRGRSAPVEQREAAFDVRLWDVAVGGRQQFAVGSAAVAEEDGVVVNYPVIQQRTVRC